MECKKLVISAILSSAVLSGAILSGVASAARANATMITYYQTAAKVEFAGQSYMSCQGIEQTEGKKTPYYRMAILDGCDWEYR